MNGHKAFCHEMIDYIMKYTTNYACELIMDIHILDIMGMRCRLGTYQQVLLSGLLGMRWQFFKT